MKTEKENILLIPIEHLNLSEECKTNLKGLGIGKLQDVITKGWQQLREMKDFNYIRFNEVIRFLDANGLVYLLEKKN